MTCEQALAHPWMAAFKSKELTLTKSLSKEKMKRFLARQKWKVSTKLLFIYLFFTQNLDFVLIHICLIESWQGHVSTEENGSAL